MTRKEVSEGDVMLSENDKTWLTEHGWEVHEALGVNWFSWRNEKAYDVLLVCREHTWGASFTKVGVSYPEYDDSEYGDTPEEALTRLLESKINALVSIGATQHKG